MANVKQLDAWRGLGPSTGGELVDYSAGPIDSELARTQAGAWLQDPLPLGSTVSAEPGMRLEWNSFTRRGVVAAAFPAVGAHRRDDRLDRRGPSGANALARKPSGLRLLPA